MKIRDLNLDDYVIVYDIAAYDIVKNEYSEGMTVVGRVDEIIFNEDGKNEAIINVTGDLYGITDNNYFDLWSNYMESKTESVSEVGFRNLNVGDWIQYVEKNGQERFGKVSNLIGLQAEKSVDNDTRIELELLNGEIDSIEQNSSEWIKVRPNEEHLLEKDYRKRFDQSNDLQQRKRNDMVNSPSHYMLGNHEVKDIVSLVADKYHKGSVAHNIASALEYQMRAPEKNGLEDIKKARKCLDFAIENWDVN